MTTQQEINNDSKLFNMEAERLAKQYRKNDLRAEAVGCKVVNAALFEQQRRKNLIALFFTRLAQTIIIAFLFVMIFFTGFLFGLVGILSR